MAPLIELAKWADLVRARIPASHAKSVLSAPTAALEEVGVISAGASLRQMAAVPPFDKTAASFWAYLVESLAPQGLRQMAVRAETDEAWAVLASDAKARGLAAVRMLEAERRFKEATDLRDDLWFGSPTRPAVPAIASRARVAASNAAALDAWLDFVKPDFPDADPASGFLRKRMLDELLRKRPSDMEEFRRDFPLELRERTELDQVRKYHEEVFEFSRRLPDNLLHRMRCG